MYGPGDIAQAHTVDEYVDIAELLFALTAYERILSAQ